MKIVITSSGTDLQAQMDPRFGRAGYFICIDTDSNDFQAVDNAQNLNAPQGAGIQAAEKVSRLGAKCLITGNCGPKAFRALQAAGIKIYTGAKGTVGEAVDQFNSGKLTEATAANVDGHWA